MRKVIVFPQTEFGTNKDLGDHAFIYCPGCRQHHSLCIRRTEHNPGPIWGFNGDTEKPTFTPSLLVFSSWPERRCHSFIQDGQIRFLSDCFHHLKNTTVELPEIDL